MSCFVWHNFWLMFRNISCYGSRSINFLIIGGRGCVTVIGISIKIPQDNFRIPNLEYLGSLQPVSFQFLLFCCLSTLLFQPTLKRSLFFRCIGCHCHILKSHFSWVISLKWLYYHFNLFCCMISIIFTSIWAIVLISSFVTFSLDHNLDARNPEKNVFICYLPHLRTIC